MLRASHDLLQLGDSSAGGMTIIQPGYFQPSGIVGPTATTPPLMPNVAVAAPFIPLQGMSPTQPLPSPVPSAQQQMLPAMMQAGSYPPVASSVGSYPASASFQAVPLQAASASSFSTTTAATSASASQNPVSFIRYFVIMITVKI